MKLAAVLSFVAFLAACTSTPSLSGAVDAAADDSSLPDASTPTSDAEMPDAATEPDASDASLATYQSCTEAELDAVDHLATGADVSFKAGVAQYTNHCVRIRVGKDVGFYGPFDIHPLAGNGEVGSPVPSLATGSDSGRIVFGAAGTFGFHCTSHAQTMWGTIKVIP
jgi:plastocyanin